MQIVEFSEDYTKFKRGMRMRLEDPTHFRKDENSWLEKDLDCVLVSNTHGKAYVPKRVLRVIGKDGNPRLLRRVYTEEEREYLLRKSRGRCACCGKKLSVEDATVEHIIPLAIGGGNLEDNLVALCLDCNKFKADNIRGAKFYKYLNESSKKAAEVYIGMFKICNTKLNDCDLLIAGADDIPLISAKWICSGGFMNTRSIPVFHSYTRDIRIAGYSDLDKLYQVFHNSTYFENSAECKDYLSKFFSDGKIYLICNGDDIKAMFTVCYENIAGYSILCFDDIFYCQKVMQGDRILCLYSVMRWMQTRLSAHLSLASAYVHLGFDEVSELIKKLCLVYFLRDVNSIAGAVAINCKRCRDDLDEILSPRFPIEKDGLELRECSGKLVLLKNPRSADGKTSLRDKDVIRKCAKLIQVQKELEKFTLILNEKQDDEKGGGFNV